MLKTEKKIIFLMPAMTLALFILFIGALAYGADFNSDWLGEKPEWAPTVSGGTSFMTKYVWRGQLLVDDPCVQPEASISKWGLTASFWGNYNTRVKKGDDSVISTQEWTELDFTGDYTFKLGEMAEKYDMEAPELLKPLGFSAGYTYYLFPNLDWKSKQVDSHEFYLGCSYDTFLKPWFKWYQDFKSGTGAYLQAGIGHTFEFAGGISADVSMTTAYNYHQWTPKAGWSDMNFSGGVNIPVFRYFTLRPVVAYSLLLDRDTYEDRYGSEFYCGGKVSFVY